MTDTPSLHIQPGTILAERYELTAEIGRGGFGLVYQGRQLNMDREVAIKLLPPEFMNYPDIVARFKREARLASRLLHPNTVTLHDYGQHEGLLYIVMELLRGEDLANVLKRETIVQKDRAIRLARQVLRALTEAHQLGIVHRDLKPENIFLASVGNERDHVKVLDFGIATLASGEADKYLDETGRRLTMSGSTVGTPMYMSPEQAAGEEVDGQTDLYAVGIMLFEMVCGHPPFADDNPVKIMRAHLFEEIPPLSRDDLRGTRFEKVLRKALAKDRDLRFARAEDFELALTGDDLFEPIDRLIAPNSSPQIVAPPNLFAPPPRRKQPPPSQANSSPRFTSDSGDVPLSETASFEAQARAVAAQDLRGEHSGPPHDDAVPFGAVPQRARVHESSPASVSGLSELSSDGLPRMDLQRSTTTSSIITVLGEISRHDEDVIVLDKPKPANHPANTDDYPSYQPSTDELAPDYGASPFASFDSQDSEVVVEEIPRNPQTPNYPGQSSHSGLIALPQHDLHKLQQHDPNRMQQHMRSQTPPQQHTSFENTTLHDHGPPGTTPLTKPGLSTGAKALITLLILSLIAALAYIGMLLKLIPMPPL